MYYVYIHYRTDNNLPFYVGKGCRSRAYSIKGRNPDWERVVSETDYYIRIIEDNLTESAAFEREKFYIELIGYGNLTNISHGYTINDYPKKHCYLRNSNAHSDCIDYSAFKLKNSANKKRLFDWLKKLKEL